MREVIQIDVHKIKPESRSVFALQGYPADVTPDPRAEALYQSAMGLLTKLAKPVAVWSEIASEEFRAIYKGEGNNAPDTPLAKIYPKAVSFALFAATIGEDVCKEIKFLFEKNDFALGSMLDSVASVATDLIGDRIEELYLQRAVVAPLPVRDGLLRYSPGYCGWHISAQGALFKALRPREIGITLRDSFLMQPLKSISGVMLSGRPEIHLFKPDYPFCSDCCTKSCGDRIQKMKKRREGAL